MKKLITLFIFITFLPRLFSMDLPDSFEISHTNLDNGFTILHSYAITGEYQDLRNLVKQFGVDCKDGNKQAPLHLASIHGHSHLVKFLLRQKANINLQDAMGFTPLHYAVLYGHLPIVKELLKYNPWVNIPNKSGYTELITAFFASSLNNESATILQLLVNNQFKEASNYKSPNF
jgi:ankyrin repeat protein